MASPQMQLMRASVVASVLCTVSAVPNGLGMTPPLAWSSWNYFVSHLRATLLSPQHAQHAAGTLAAWSSLLLHMRCCCACCTRGQPGRLVVVVPLRGHSDVRLSLAIEQSVARLAAIVRRGRYAIVLCTRFTHTCSGALDASQSVQGAVCAVGACAWCVTR